MKKKKNHHCNIVQLRRRPLLFTEHLKNVPGELNAQNLKIVTGTRVIIIKISSSRENTRANNIANTLVPRKPKTRVINM